MATRLINATERAHLPARSATPTAWMALGVLVVVIGGWLFFDSIVCGAIRLGLAAVAWNGQVALSIDHLEMTRRGGVRAEGIMLASRSQEHRSTWKIDELEIRPASLWSLLGFSNHADHHLIQEINLGKSKLLLDRRDETGVAKAKAHEMPLPHALAWVSLLPAAFTAGSMDLVVIGENYRISATDLNVWLPDRWAGALWYSEAVLDVDSIHQVLPAATAPASWNGNTLRLGRLDLLKELQLVELTLTPRPDRLEFGVRGTVGDGLLRGDGAIGFSMSRSFLDATLVGENLKLEALSMLVKQSDPHATGTIRQGRLTFRGDPARPLEADCSLRLVADAFRWEGRGWDSLRVAATLTGRALTVSELTLHQKENIVEAEGQSKLPEDWHAALQAPFTATFHASLEDARALAALAGPDFAPLSGGLMLEGAIKGAENRAEGYCTLLGTEMKIRNLPVNWLRGCLLFEGEKTQLSYLEAWSGEDRVMMAGTIQNSRPHAYSANADFSVSNLTKRLAQLGIATATQIGGGAVQGTWQGDGSTQGHSGSFQAKVTKWISPWTMAGMSGSFEGSYSPGRLYCSKAEFQQNDLRLSLQLSASPTRLEGKSIVASREGKSEPLVQGDFSLPLNAPELWQSGDIVSNLEMADPLALNLTLHGIKAEELADLLGQHLPVSGLLEGELSAKGTPQEPQIHSTLRVVRLTLPDSSNVKGLNWSFDSSGGRATSHLVQEPATNSPLTLEAELPFRFTAEKGELHLAVPTAPIKASATLHHVPLNGWFSLWSVTSNLHDGRVDGSLTLGGTLEKPSLDGNLLLELREASFAGFGLSAIKLPISCSLNKVLSTGGTARYAEKPVMLSGGIDWHEVPWKGHLDLAAKDIPFPKIAEIESRGDGKVTLQMQGTKMPLLTGTLLIKSVAGTLPTRAIPYFVPPGFVPNGERALFQPQAGSNPWQQLQITLAAKTAGALPLMGSSSNETTTLRADLQLIGSWNALQWSGSIDAQNIGMDLPAGRFVIPQASLHADVANGEKLNYKAYGLTGLGFCTLTQDGPISSMPTPELLAAPQAVTEADLVWALASAQGSTAQGSRINQATAWLRQNIFFPLPAAGWVTRQGEDYQAGALGFYGSPWGMSFLQPSATTSSLPEEPSTAKN